MKLLKSGFVKGVLFALVLMFLPVEANAAWRQEDGQWYYYQYDKIMQTGWILLDEGWYYLNEDGTMHTGWLWLDEQFYYLREDGVMHTGWLQMGYDWYYMKEDGAMAEGSVDIGGTTYNFNTGGVWIAVPDTGWHDEDGYSYFQDRGKVQTGWFTDGSGVYHADGEGRVDFSKDITERVDANFHMSPLTVFELSYCLSALPNPILSSYLAEYRLTYILDPYILYAPEDEALILGYYYETGDTKSINFVYLGVYGDEVVCHEFGHYFDMGMLGKVSDSEEFIRLNDMYALEFSKGIGDYYSMESRQEFFSELFMYTVLYPEDCARLVPEAYAYMSGLIEGLYTN